MDLKFMHGFGVSSRRYFIESMGKIVRRSPNVYFVNKPIDDDSPFSTENSNFCVTNWTLDFN